MLCRNPFVLDVRAFSCGQCMPCRVNRRRLWAHRIFLESLKHSDNGFVTLTYEEKKLPPDGSLVPSHTRDWLKRLRFAVKDETSIRYFLVGEYGEQSQRPHYHAAIFGLGPRHSGTIQSTWGHGFTYTGDLTNDSASYIAGYVTKKMTNPTDPRLNGRFPEFARMSLRPGVGAYAIPEIHAVLSSKHGLREIERVGDVPQALVHGQKARPLGRYLRAKLREGFKDASLFKQNAVEAHVSEMREIWKEYYASSESAKTNKKDYLKKINTQGFLNMEAKQKIFAQKKGKL